MSTAAKAPAQRSRRELRNEAKRYVIAAIEDMLNSVIDCDATDEEYAIIEDEIHTIAARLTRSLRGKEQHA